MFPLRLQFRTHRLICPEVTKVPLPYSPFGGQGFLEKNVSVHIESLVYLGEMLVLPMLAKPSFYKCILLFFQLLFVPNRSMELVPSWTSQKPAKPS